MPICLCVVEPGNHCKLADIPYTIIPITITLNIMKTRVFTCVHGSRPHSAPFCSSNSSSSSSSSSRSNSSSSGTISTSSSLIVVVLVVVIIVVVLVDALPRSSKSALFMPVTNFKQ